ncbi:receptor-like protein kinase [Musa troglodytarum]|uniref:Receptor-like protein kinase n=1 Tax=Musa troglodytarum TaxID=320322 RepID=A0A9E7GWU6_9LILI|nr:receptor-like protein kinase [Musa troglodytarum]
MFPANVSSSSLFPLLGFVLLILCHSSLTGAQNLDQICDASGSFADNSTYQSNLKLYLSSLPSKGSVSGFLKETVGEVPDQVYGVSLCRGDVNASECRACLNKASLDVQQICPYNKGAMIYYDYCLLRFSNQNFLSSTDNQQVPKYNSSSVTQVVRLSQLLHLLLSSATDWAANSTKRFATGEMSNFTSEFPTIYVMVECTPDLSPSDCSQCLQSLFDPLPTDMVGRQGARVIGVRCVMRYELSSFSKVPSMLKLTAPEQLRWGTRYRIIRGIAQGLLYLHEESQLKIIHRDLKTSMNPKISDFGIAKLFDADQTQDTTKRVVGTFGYMAPEYVKHGKFSVRSDVFSFGILVLEILTGRKNSKSYNSEYSESLLSYSIIAMFPVIVSSSSLLPLLGFVLLILCHSSLTGAQNLDQICDASGSFADNSTYQSNLKLYLSSLPSKGSVSGFLKETVGEVPDQVYGVSLCRGDVNASECRACLNKASLDVQQICPYNKGAMIYYDYCLLRFSNQNFLSSTNNQQVPKYNSSSVTQVVRLSQLLHLLLSSATDWAANSTKRFATGEMSNFTSEFPTIYVMVECTPDLSPSDCSQCLQSLFDPLPTDMVGKQGARVIGVRCCFRYELSSFSKVPSMVKLTAPMEDATQLPSDGSAGKKKNAATTALAIAIPAFTALLILSLIYICYWRTRKRIIQSAYETVPELITGVESLLFDLSTLRLATANFSEENKLGEGGFGVVYKGQLPDGREIAVKKLLNAGRGLGELQNELLLVAKLQHRNLVRLLGVCLEEEKMIVYEYVPNRSLDKVLFDPERSEQLRWGTRYRIIRGIAQGLLYLHEESQLKIIHRDLKASNILLDAGMNPKISDFGIAKLFDADQTQDTTKRVVGTFGYMAPEYVKHGKFSVRSDVFSFGILVLEILTGRKNSKSYNSEHSESLLSYTWEKWRCGSILEMVDPALDGHYQGSDLLRCMQIGLLCVQENPNDRPTMSTVVTMLNSGIAFLQAPGRPAFYVEQEDVNVKITANDATIAIDVCDGESMPLPASSTQVSISEQAPR